MGIILPLGGISVDEKCDIFYSNMEMALEAIPFTYVEINSITTRRKSKMKSENPELNLSQRVTSLKRKPSGIWKKLNSGRKMPCLVGGQDQELSFSPNIPDPLNQAFSNVFTPSTLANYNPPGIPTDKRWNISVSVSNERLIQKLKNGKSPGLDQIATRILQ